MKKNFTRRVIALLLSVMVIASAVPFAAIPASAATTHSHPLCGSSCRCESETHSSLTWTAWDGTTKLTGGNYYLTKDVELSSTMILDYSYTTRLCLNGYSITCEDRVFDIYSYRSLTITDCDGTGKIETTGYDCTIGNNKYLSIWGGTVLNSGEGLAIEAYGNTTTYVCGGRVESTEYDAIYACPNSKIYVQGGTVKGSYCAISGNDVSGGSNSETVISGGTLTSVYSGDTVSVQSGSFTMTGGTVDGVVNVFPEYGKTTISGGTIGSLNTSSKEISITGGTILGETIDNWIDGESATVAGGTFAGSCYFSSDNTEIGGGNFSACETVEISENSGKTWIYGGKFDDITVYGSLYLSASPEINSLTVMKTGLVSAHNPDLSTSYGGEPIEVILSNELTSWKDGDTIVKNVNSDAVAQKFVYVGDDSRWVSLKRYNSNCVLDVIPHGSCGNDAYWAVEDNTLYIYGTGAVTYNDSGSKYPWWPYVDEIENIIVEEGITKIPAYTFEYCESAKTITLPETLTELHISAFNDCGSLNNLLLPSSLTKISYYNCYINRCDSLTDLYYLGTAEELRTLLNGSTLSNWGGVPVLTVHCLELREGSSSCTEEGTSSYYQFDDTSVYGGMYDMDKNPITSLDRVPALGHDEIHHEAKAPTCTESGWNEYVTCSRCDYTSYAELAPLGHEYADGVCTRCGNVSVCVPEGLVYEINYDGSICITGYTGNARDLVIPSEIDGIVVEWIGDYAFNQCNSLVTVTFPDSIIGIGCDIFDGCENLISANIPRSMSSVPHRMFFRCTSIEEVILHDEITEIESYAFCGCENLTKIIIPESVTQFGQACFGECSSLANIDLPDNITSIANLMFDNCISLTEINIPESVTYIGSGAFSGCTNLTRVNIPNGVTAIQSSTFNSCVNITNITIPEKIVCIDDWAFCGCEKLDGIIIPDSVKKIGYRAFYNCTSLKELKIPENVTKIEAETFTLCVELESINIPSNTTSIGNQAFWGCKKLSDITLPDSITTIGEGAFFDCDGFTKITIPEGVTVIKGSTFNDCGNLATINLPSTLTTIEDNAFVYCSKLTTISIPDSVTYIGKWAFFGCSRIESITIPEGITNIYENTFYACSKLSSIRLPESINQIDIGAFKMCSSLSSIIIPKSVIYICDQAFDMCRNLSTVYYDGTEEEWNSVSIGSYNEWLTNAEIIFLSEPEAPAVPEGLAYEIADGIEVIILGYTGSAAELVIPAEIEGYPVTCIDNSAFAFCRSLERIIIPDTVMRIGSEAFFKCTSLTEIIIPDSITSICDNTFAECESLTSVILPEFLTTIGYQAFSNCYNLTDITIPGSVTDIGDYAFSFCESLTGIVLPESVTSIGCGAFLGCSGLESITIPKSVTSIVDEVFGECLSLTTVYYAGTKAEWSVVVIGSGNEPLTNAEIIFLGVEEPAVPEGLEYEIIDGEAIITDYTGNATELVIPATIEGSPVTSIGEEAFYDCYSLTSIEIPVGVTSIGDYAFYYCYNLTSIEIPEGVTSIGGGIVGGCVNLKSLTVDINNTVYYSEGNCIISKEDKVLVAGCNVSVIPDSVTRIGDYAFYRCSSLTSIEIPDGVTSIGEYAFSACSSLTSIEIPDSVTSIGNRAFSACSSLTSIEIPEGVTSIGDSAFYHCRSLTSIEIPEGVTSIGEYAFFKCISLTTVYYGGTEEMWNAISIASGNEYLTNAEIIFLGVEEPEIPEFIPGDLDENGAVNGKDSYVLSCVISGYSAIDMGSAAFYAADLDGDGSLSGKDAFILRCIISGNMAV